MALPIREVTAADSAEWLRMRQALWPDEAGLDAGIREYFARPGHGVTLVAERPGGGLAGFVEASIRSFAEGCESQPVAFVEGWYVDPDVRRQGIGAALIRAVERWAIAAGFRELGSDTTLDNTASQAAHRALGFTEVERVVCFRRVLDGPTN